jgi:hypothetical protein
LTDKNEINIEEANGLMDKIKKYQTSELAGGPGANKDIIVNILIR